MGEARAGRHRGSPVRGAARLARRAGALGVAFFAVKGLVWLALLAGGALYAMD